MAHLSSRSKARARGSLGRITSNTYLESNPLPQVERDDVAVLVDDHAVQPKRKHLKHGREGLEERARSEHGRAAPVCKWKWRDMIDSTQ